ncbi:hypothetical protein H2201_006263 [Coniosporium apollinis]|uniref:CCHC-type domain-containing protein n=2 Tax=Coniosporium TaxID=2810619 RepID=A0ABQ9NRF3_9PEZI|nr:hypothetical protein H2199_004310 [Cladosporium sp. JES 115]KAJ9661974.1 hypothetical protein H2201_006263 [Coniosporium apollinis]
MGDAFNWAAVHASRLPQFVNPVDHICFACGGRGHFSQDCIEASDGTTSAASHQAIIHPSRLAQIEDDIANSICSACGGLGHLSEDCTLPNGPDPGPIPPGKGANAEPLGGNAKRRHVSQPTKEPHKRQKQQQPRPEPPPTFHPENGQALPAPSSVRQSWQPYEPMLIKHEEPLGSGQVQPSTGPSLRPSYGYPRKYSNFQKLAPANDPELLQYLSSRRIAKTFLVEIDLLLASHPELLHDAREFALEFNRGTPLQAYKFFIKGYTKPARYEPGALPEQEYDLRTMLPYTPTSSLSKKFDEELSAFFEGYQYRVDILMRIDKEAETYRRDFLDNSPLSAGQRKLMIYALFGNPVDAYKFYEYNFQTEWLPHRYLPEHVVFAEVSKPDDYALPVPHVMAREGEIPEHRRLWKETRLRMARAADAGVDVIDVLLDELVHRLACDGLKRVEIEEMRKRAVKAMDRARDEGSREDIVDLVMGMSVNPAKHLHNHDLRNGRPFLRPTTSRAERDGRTRPAAVAPRRDSFAVDSDDGSVGGVRLPRRY